MKQTKLGDQPTERQQELYDYILRFCEMNGMPPTIREIGADMGISSPNGVACHLRALERKGLIATPGQLSRGYRPVCGWTVEPWED